MKVIVKLKGYSDRGKKQPHRAVSYNRQRSPRVWSPGLPTPKIKFKLRKQRRTLTLTPTRDPFPVSILKPICQLKKPGVDYRVAYCTRKVIIPIIDFERKTRSSCDRGSKILH